MYRVFVQARSSAIRQTFTVGDRASGFGNFSWATQRLMQLFDSVVSFATSLMRSNWSSGNDNVLIGKSIGVPHLLWYTNHRYRCQQIPLKKYFLPDLVLDKVVERTVFDLL